MTGVLQNFLTLDGAALAALSRERGLSLTEEEMLAIQSHFRSEKRAPSEAELETLAQTWSEHCKHKTFRAAVDYVEKTADGREIRRTYDDLLKETVMKVTRELDKPWCLSVFKDNAGVIDIDGKNAAAFKVETHNHPSALEPYGGAGTGIGGVIRDIMGVGLGAKPVANTDVFCFAPLDHKDTKTVEGVLPPRRIFHGVVSGVRDYGNRMGIPTVNGAVVFDEDFHYNPLVFCGTLGVMPHWAVEKDVKSGDLVVMMGGRVGRDGIHGATFSSDSLTTGISSSVVQIGDPIVQKKTLDVLLAARDRKLYRGMTDCGAGGLSSAVGEMGEKSGVEVHLERVPLKYSGLAPWEIWLSESQERMVLAVPPERWPELKALCASEDVEATDIGVFTSDHRLRVLHAGQVFVDIPMSFLHDGNPKWRLAAFWSETEDRPFTAARRSLAGALPGVLSLPSVASKEWIIRQYDHEVQGRTVGKPLTGKRGVGPSDGSVTWMGPGSKKGLALANGINPVYSRWDAYWMAGSAIDEAIRNLVAVGANPDKIAVLDNFCAGNPRDPAIMGQIVRASQACYDFGKTFGTPFISGKDSLNNQFVEPSSGKKKDIPTTLLISALGVIEDVSRCVTSDFKRSGDFVYLVGLTFDELGGSQYGAWLGAEGGRVPRVNAADNLKIYRALHRAIKSGLVAACHDVSEGGLAVALAEMAIGGDLGATVDLRKAPWGGGVLRTEAALFSESNGRFVVEVEPPHRAKFESAMGSRPFACLGKVTRERRLTVTGTDGSRTAWTVDRLEKAFRGGVKP